MKIARVWQDTDVTWMAVPRRMAARRLFDLVGRADVGIEAPFVAQRIEHRRPVDDPRRHQVDHPFLASLHLALGEHQPRRHARAALAFEKARPAPYVDDPALILERDEDRIALARPLADQHHTPGAQLGRPSWRD